MLKFLSGPDPTKIHLFTPEITAALAEALPDLKHPSLSNEVPFHFRAHTGDLPISVATTLQPILMRALLPVKQVFEPIDGKTLLEELDGFLETLSNTASMDPAGLKSLNALIQTCFNGQHLSEACRDFLFNGSSHTGDYSRVFAAMRERIFEYEDQIDLAYYSRTTLPPDAVVTQHIFNLFCQRVAFETIKIHQRNREKAPFAHVFAALSPHEYHFCIEALLAALPRFKRADHWLLTKLCGFQEGDAADLYKYLVGTWLAEHGREKEERLPEQFDKNAFLTAATRLIAVLKAAKREALLHKLATLKQDFQNFEVCPIKQSRIVDLVSRQNEMVNPVFVRFSQDTGVRYAYDKVAAASDQAVAAFKKNQLQHW